MTRKAILAGALFGATGIILGAFGAHALKKVLSEVMLNAFEVGVRYQMYHALLLLFVGLAPLGDKARKGIFRLTVAGVLCFSGSLYLLAMGEALSLGLSFLGPVTPIGGFLLITAWLWLFLDFFRRKA